MNVFYKLGSLLCIHSKRTKKDRDSTVINEISVLRPESCIAVPIMYIQLLASWVVYLCKLSPEVRPTRVFLPERFACLLAPSALSFQID